MRCAVLELAIVRGGEHGFDVYSVQDQRTGENQCTVSEAWTLRNLLVTKNNT